MQYSNSSPMLQTYDKYHICVTLVLQEVLNILHVYNYHLYE